MSPAYIFSTSFYIVPCFALIILTFRDQFRKPALSRAAFGIAMFLVITFAASGLYYCFADSSLARSLLSLTGILSGVFLFTAIVNYHFLHSVFIISTLKTYAENVILLTTYIYFIALGEMPTNDSLAASALLLAAMALTFPLVFLFFKKLLRPALDYTHTLSPWHQMWLIPVCNNLLYTLIISPDFFRSSPQKLSEFYFIPPLWTLMTFATYSLLLHMIITVSEANRLRERLHISETQISSQLKQAEILQERIAETSRARHDRRHHILALQSLVKAQDWSKLNDYLQEYASLVPDTPVSYCKNPAINAFLCYYQDLAEKAGIQTSLSVSLPDELPFPDIDLCAILGNLLENAIEACQRMTSKDRYLRLKLSMTSSTVLILLLENSYEGSIHRHAGSFLSLKGKNRIGIGISSVIDVVEKYNGVHKFEYQNHNFKVSLLLNTNAKA